MASATMNHEMWEARAIELAETKHAIGTPHYCHASEYGHVWRVPSRSSNGSYDVLAWSDGRIECSCMAGSYGRACSHAGAVLQADRVRQKAMAQPDRDVMAAWRNGGTW